MKMLKEKMLIVIIIIGGLFATSAAPRTLNTLDNKDMIISEADYEAIAKRIFQTESDQITEKLKACCKVYNSKFQLVYMSRDENDAHLNQLKQYCDLIMKAGNTTFYMISDY